MIRHIRATSKKKPTAITNTNSICRMVSSPCNAGRPLRNANAALYPQRSPVACSIPVSRQSRAHVVPHVHCSERGENSRFLHGGPAIADSWPCNGDAADFSLNAALSRPWPALRIPLYEYCVRRDFHGSGQCPIKTPCTFIRFRPSNHRSLRGFSIRGVFGGFGRLRKFCCSAPCVASDSVLSWPRAERSLFGFCLQTIKNKKNW
jgi:hypothetical protein